MLDKKIKALLPDIIKDTMDALTALTNAPDEMTLPVTLAVANFATQALYNVDPLAWDPCATSEYFVVLVPSGGMKTSLSSMLLEGINRFEKEQEIATKQAQLDYKLDIKKFNRLIDDEVKNPTGIKLKEPIKPKGARYKVEKATVNGLINTLDCVPFAGLFSSDAGEFFNSHSFNDKNRSNEMVSTLSKAWSGEPLDRITGIEDNNIRLRDRRFNMLVLLQQELAGFLNDKTMQQQGFIHRLLVTQCGLFEKNESDFSISGKNAIKAQRLILQPFNDRVYDLLLEVELAQAQARTVTILKGPTMWQQMQAQAFKNLDANPNELILPVMDTIFGDNARKMLTKVYNHYAKIAVMKEHQEYASFYNRAFEHIMRLAATLAIFDKKNIITEREAECAIGLVEYFVQQRLTMEVDGETKHNFIIEESEKFLKWLKKQPNQECTKTQLNSKLKSLQLEERGKILQELESREMIEMVEVPSLGVKKKHLYRAL